MIAQYGNAVVVLLIPLFLILSCNAETESEQVYPKIDRIIAEGIDERLFPGAVVLIAEGDQVLHHKAYGHANAMDAEKSLLTVPEPMTIGHLFDLASLTKVLATTYGIMILEDQGKISVDDPVSDYLPEFAAGSKNSITVRHLLTHTSGLMQWFPTYYVASDKSERQQFISGQPLHNPVGEARSYSDFGFMVLSDLIEEVSGHSLDEFLNEQLYRPLGLEHTLFNPSAENHADIVSTSHGNPFERRMVYDDDFGYKIDIDPEAWDEWRSHTLHGEASDANAFHTHQGIAGHAGLFSTASDIYKLLFALSDSTTAVVGDSTVAKFLSPDQFGEGLGWMMTPNSLHAPDDLPRSSFGHTGFTGTNIVVVPRTEHIIIVLTNRQNYGVLESGYYPNLREFRMRIVEAVLEDPLVF
ncbi:MAG: serine hydrolase domain-containing protein [Balneolales bacterium]